MEYADLDLNASEDGKRPNNAASLAAARGVRQSVCRTGSDAKAGSDAQAASDAKTASCDTAPEYNEIDWIRTNALLDTRKQQLSQRNIDG